MGAVIEPAVCVEEVSEFLRDASRLLSLLEARLLLSSAFGIGGDAFGGSVDPATEAMKRAYIPPKPEGVA